MKTPTAALQLFVVLCLATVLGGCYRYQALIPAHTISAGSVIHASDLTESGESVWLLGGPGDYATDRSQVIGHRALRTLRAGGYISQSDISPIVETAK